MDLNETRERIIYQKDGPIAKITLNWPRRRKAQDKTRHLNLKTQRKHPTLESAHDRKDLRLSALGARGFATRFSASHFDGGCFGWVEKLELESEK